MPITAAAPLKNSEMTSAVHRARYKAALAELKVEKAERKLEKAESKLPSEAVFHRERKAQRKQQRKKAQKAAKTTKSVIQKTAEFTEKVVSGIVHALTSPVFLIVMLIIALVLVLVFCLVSLFGSIGAESGAKVILSSYTSEDEQMYQSEEYMAGLEEALREKVNSIPELYLPALRSKKESRRSQSLLLLIFSLPKLLFRDLMDLLVYLS